MITKSILSPEEARIYGVLLERRLIKALKEYKEFYERLASR